MPSHFANEIIRTIQNILTYDLTSAEKLKCEEIVLNFYPGAAKRHCVTWHKSLVQKRNNPTFEFNHFYNPIMCGIIVGARKRAKDQMYRFDSQAKRDTYSIMHSYLGTDFSMRELEDIVWFTEFATQHEVQTAVNVAQHHGVINSAYVRAIIVGNRRKAAAQLRAKDEKFKHVTDDPPDIKVGVPNVRSLQDAWTKRLRGSIDRQTEKQVEDNAERKLSI